MHKAQLRVRACLDEFIQTYGSVQAEALKLDQTELKEKGKKKKGIQNKPLHAMKFGNILNRNKAMNELMAFISTNKLMCSLIYLTDGIILPQQREDLGREVQKTINTGVFRTGFSEAGLHICDI